MTGECASAMEIASAAEFAAKVNQTAHAQGLLEDVCWVNDTMEQDLTDSVGETLKGLARVNSIPMPDTDDGTDDEGRPLSSDASSSRTEAAQTVSNSEVGARKHRSNVTMPRKRPTAMATPGCIEV